MPVSAANPRAFCLVSLCLCAGLFGACGPSQTSSPASPNTPQTSQALNEDDAAWQRAASLALGDREGAVIVMDAQTGRVRAVVNPRLAFEQAFPPGSAVKPFTALAALQSGIATRDTTATCTQHYARDDFQITCSHAPFNRPLKLTEALAHSCNYYFSRLGERLNASPFNAALEAFGFGMRTGVNAAHEAAGTLKREEIRAGDAVGEGEHLLVTPIQLITAYAALANGGHLNRPRLAATGEFKPQEVRAIHVPAAHRAVLIEGMRGAVLVGTASRAGFDRLPLDIVGKTGTSTASNGFRRQGWFVGLAAERGQRADTPEAIKLAVLVFLKRSHGADCAEVARRVVECGVRSAECGINAGAAATQSQISNLQLEIRGTPAVRVKLTRTGEVREFALEEYVRGVVAGEASIETEGEALQAQAVVSRTFALKNLGRHAKEGYDFCDLTHCQSFTQRAASNAGAANRAVGQTAGQVLTDERGRTANVYFHAACGGRTTSMADLWGVASPAYLRGVTDEACAALPHRQWQQTIPAAKLNAALRSDERSNVGATLGNITITKRDTSGRAAMVTIDGARRRTLCGWDFALIVNRALGWSTLKSAKFDVRRAGDAFVFRGSGLGHGLGLCQEGAHLLAQRGASAERILAHYFPGTQTKRQMARSTPELPPASFVLPARATLSSEHFRATFPAQLPPREVEAVLHTLESAHAELARRLEAASLRHPLPGPVTVNIHASTGDFVGATGQPAWAAAATNGRTMQLQPPAVLRRRGVLNETLRHEYAHVVIESFGRRDVPRWLAEGLAIHVAGEAAKLARFAPSTKLSRDELERRLVRPSSAAEMRMLYAAAAAEVQAVIRAEGEAGAWRRVARP